MFLPFCGLNQQANPTFTGTTHYQGRITSVRRRHQRERKNIKVQVTMLESPAAVSVLCILHHTCLQTRVINRSDSGLRWVGHHWKNMMSHTSVYRKFATAERIKIGGQLAHFLQMNSNHKQSPDEADRLGFNPRRTVP